METLKSWRNAGSLRANDPGTGGKPKFPGEHG